MLFKVYAIMQFIIKDKKMSDWENAGNFWEIATVQSVEMALAGGRDVNARNPDLLTPLHLAATHSDNPEVIKALVKGGANLNPRDKMARTPLHFAMANNKNPEIIRALLEGGANKNARDICGNTPLHFAVDLEIANPDVITVLLAYGADGTLRNQAKETPFDEAKRNGLLKNTDAYWELRESTWALREKYLPASNEDPNKEI